MVRLRYYWLCFACHTANAVDVDLSGFTMSSQFFIAFFIAFERDRNNNNDRLYIDDVEIIADGP